MLACARYEGAMRRLLHAYKYGRRRVLAGYFAGSALQTLERHAPNERFDAVIAVPSGRGRLLERGFNPPGLIASRVARGLGVRDLSDRLRRTDGGRSQSLLGRTQRLARERTRFSARALDGRIAAHVLLIDDILTTGATVSDCALALKSSGVKRVTALVLTRGSMRP
ncbi:MAG: hypothetical protein MOGMAGMI_00441 [Candidatus Omnitrophica bacterium]|nr:hypothetical protein [Candidatus Omnitrophota bacterium]